ncbi:MAG: septum formation inhibitor Maf [Gammaproteobacteria bacterium]|nr:septum formation inhibitor Maf [Gammaproteobacteria bacterium]
MILDPQLTEHDDLVLASASPRRRELLRQIGMRFRVAPAEVDETVKDGEEPGEYVLRLAREKALSILRRDQALLPVLGADTSVILSGEILGKPADRAEAADMLGRLSGNTHQVYSAVAVALPGEERVFDRLNITRVTFAPLEPEWIQAYIDTGDPMDKAGAYGVQGHAAERISRIEGSFSGVMGLPLYETAQLLETARCYPRACSH